MEQQGWRCPSFLGVKDCDPRSPRFLIGGRGYCFACSAAISQFVARSVQA